MQAESCSVWNIAMAMGRASKNAHGIVDVLLQQLPEGRKPTYVLLGPPEVCHRQGGQQTGQGGEVHKSAAPCCTRIFEEIASELRTWAILGDSGSFLSPVWGCHSIWRRAGSRWVASWTARHSWERWIHCRWTVLSKFISQALESQQESVIQETS